MFLLLVNMIWFQGMHDVRLVNSVDIKTNTAFK